MSCTPHLPRPSVQGSAAQPGIDGGSGGNNCGNKMQGLSGNKHPECKYTNPSGRVEVDIIR